MDGQLYNQIDGVAIGSPLGPTLVNIFMYAPEQNVLSNCPSSLKPLIYRRFLGDTFYIFETYDQIW